MMPAVHRVSMVVPTHNRSDALRDTVPSMLAVEGVDEILFVDDASDDDTSAVLAAIDDPRVRVVRQPVRSGVQAARNRGAAETSGEWVVYGEDDCRMPPGYVTTMLAEAAEHGADVVGAPWVFSPDRPVEDALAQARAHAVDSVPFDGVERFPARTLRTPFLPALALIRREVFDHVRYDPGYTGNAFREETDFFVAANRAGFTCILTPLTYSFQVARWSGGHHTARFVYELSSVRNTGRFLRIHGAWLHERGHIDAPWREWLRFTSQRAGYLARWYPRTAALRVARAVGLR